MSFLGEKLLRLDKAARALPIFERMTVLHPRSALQWLNLARADRALGRTADAAREISTAYELDPFDPPVLEAYERLQSESDGPLEWGKR